MILLVKQDKMIAEREAIKPWIEVCTMVTYFLSQVSISKIGSLPACN